MGQFILFLLGLFAIGCVLYGVSAGVQVIQHGISRLTEGANDSAPAAPSSPNSQSPVTVKATVASSPLQHSIEVLRELFTLYQQGALTQEEFDGMKQCLLVGTKTTARQRY